VNDYLADGSAPNLIDRMQLRSNVSDLFHKGSHHQTMYDAKYLAFLFRQSGFLYPKQKEFRQSLIPDIESVELESRKDESLYMEAAR
jgi:hypothetical protein